MKLKKLLAALAVALIAVLASVLPARAMGLIGSGIQGTCEWTIYADGILEIAPKNGGTIGLLEPNNQANTPKWGWLEYADQIVGAAIDSTVYAEDLSYLFAGCKILSWADLSGLRGDYVTTMQGMFYDCAKLQKADLTPLSKTTKLTDMSYMFCGCHSLEDLRLWTLDTSHVTDISCMFKSCWQIDYIMLDAFDTSSVTDASFMFQDCTALKDIDLHILNAPKLENCTGMFFDCTSLGIAYLTNWNAPNLKYINSMFLGCTSLKSFNADNVYLPKLTQMNSTFEGCTALTELNLRCFDTRNVNYMDRMFYGCSSLKTIYINWWWSTESLFKTAQDVFTGCTKLVGGQGTKYNASKVGSTYARADASGTPGYLTSTKGWQKVDGQWVFFGDDSQLVKNAWIAVGDSWCWLDSTGHVATNQFVAEGANTSFCYVGADGLAVKGWKQIGGYWYYFDEWGEALVGTTLKYSGAWYFFDEDGHLVIDTFISTEDSLYYFGKDGKLVYNKWFEKDGRYYFAQSNGRVIQKGWVFYGGKYYYIKDNGSVARNEWITWEGKQYHFNASYACDQVK